MKRSTKILIVALALVCAFAGGIVGTALQGRAAAEQGAAAEAEAPAETTTVVVTSPFTQAIREVRDSVVGVNNYQVVSYGYGGWGRGRQSQEVKAASGSGVVVAEGYVLTNYHVVQGASTVTIAVQNSESVQMSEYDCTVVVYDVNLDLAVLHCPDLDLRPVTLGDSDTLQVGDWAICIGNPVSEEFYGTVTVGIVSALDRTVTTGYDRRGRSTGTNAAMIQVDADINNGNSGGGMFSVTGELMGIPTMKYTGSYYSSTAVDGIGLCIPINQAKPLIAEALNADRTAPAAKGTEEDGTNAGSLQGKPRLGVTIGDLNDNAYAIRAGLIPDGAMVMTVDAGSPAAEAGILPGDIITEADGTKLTSVTQLQSMIAQHGAGDEIRLRVYRATGMLDAYQYGAEIPSDGTYIDVTVTLRVVDEEP